MEDRNSAQRRAARAARNRNVAASSRRRSASGRSRSRSTQQSRGTAASRSKEEVRRAHRSKREKQRRARRRFRLFLVFLLVLITAIVLCLTVFFKIADIRVEGHSQYTDAQIIAASGVSKGDNLFLSRTSKVRENLNRALPYTDEVTLERKLPDTLVIHVNDSRITTAIQDGSSYVLLNSSDVVMKVSRNKQELQQIMAEQAERKEIDRTPPTSVTATVPSSRSQTGTLSGSTTSSSASQTRTTQSRTRALSRITPGLIIAHAAATSSAQWTASSTTASTTDAETASEKAMENLLILRGLKVKSAEIGKPVEVAENDNWQLCSQIRKDLRSLKFQGVTMLDVRRHADIQMMYRNRILIRLGSSSDLSEKLQMAKSVLRQQDAFSDTQTGELDVSISGKAYFMAGKITSTSKRRTTSASSVSSTARRSTSASLRPTTARPTGAYGVNTRQMTSHSW